MNRQSIHQQIDLLLNALAGQHKQFRDGTGTIQQVELDLLLQNTRQLYEAILLLNHNNALSSLDEVKTAVMQRILAEKKVIEKKAEEVNVQKQEPVEPVADQPKEQPSHHAGLEEVMVKAATAQPSEVKKEKTVKTKKLSGGLNATLFEEAHTLADNFEDEITLHEHIAGQGTGKTIAEDLHRKPILDLKAAIGINEKFLFINQLFDGNLQDYSAAIEKLNKATDLAAARQLIAADLASRFNWTDDDEHVISFIDLVERRFIS